MFSNGISRLVGSFTQTPARAKASAATPVLTGILAGTRVETPAGWVAVEQLTVGMRVHTLDGGLARILGIDRRILWPETHCALVHVPGGVFDICSDAMLLPGQHLLIDTMGDDSHGQAPYLLIPSVALSADPRVHRELPDLTVEVITPLFAEEEVVFANSGMMLHCPSMIDGAGRFPENSFFPRLDSGQAREFLSRRLERMLGS